MVFLEFGKTRLLLPNSKIKKFGNEVKTIGKIAAAKLDKNTVAYKKGGKILTKREYVQCLKKGI